MSLVWTLLALVAVCAALTVFLVVYELPRARALLADRRRVHHMRHLTSHEEDEEETHLIDRKMHHATRKRHSPADAQSAAPPPAEPLFEVTRETIDIESLSADGAVFESKRGVAEVLSLHGHRDAVAADGTLKPLFLILPGNPGLCNFYRLFILYMHRLCKGRVEFRCVSHPGHTSQSLNNGRRFDLNYQIAWHTAYMARLLARHPGRRIFLAGHSIGAYLALQVLASLTPEQAQRVIPQTFMLFPTISHIGRTPNGRTHTPVLNYLAPLLVGAIALVGKLPHALQTYLLFRNVGLNPYEVEAARGVLQRHTIANALHMAKHEMAEMGALQTDILDRHIDRMYFVWGTGDRWAPMEMRDELAELYGERFQCFTTDASIEHAFVVGGAHLVAPIVYKRLKQFI